MISLIPALRLLALAPIPDSTSSNEVRGSVVDERGEAVEGALVVIRDAARGQALQAATWRRVGSWGGGEPEGRVKADSSVA